MPKLGLVRTSHMWTCSWTKLWKCVCVGFLEFMHTYIKHHYAKSCSAMLWVNCIGPATSAVPLIGLLAYRGLQRIIPSIPFSISYSSILRLLYSSYPLPAHPTHQIPSLGRWQASLVWQRSPGATDGHGKLCEIVQCLRQHDKTTKWKKRAVQYSW